MHDIKGVFAIGSSWQTLLILCLLCVVLNGCAGQKRVTPPPAKPATTSKPSTMAPSSTVRTRPSVAKPTQESRANGTSLPVEPRPVATKPPVGGRPALGEPPIEEHSLEVRPAAKERPLVTMQPAPAEERPVAPKSLGEERSAAPKPPAEERPVVAEPPVKESHAEPPAEETPVATEPPADYKPVTGRAVGIYNQAEEAMQAGKYSSAEMLLERALRIEPRNAHYWYILGLAKFRQKQYPQAVQFCLKAESLAGSQPGLMARNQVLLAQAKKAAGMN